MDSSKKLLGGFSRLLSRAGNRRFTSTAVARSLLPESQQAGTNNPYRRGSRNSEFFASTLEAKSAKLTGTGQDSTNPTDDPPPAYEPPPYTPRGEDPVTNGIPAVSTPAVPRRSADNQYGFLSSFDTVFLIDDSGSMAGRSWRETGQALEAITPICVTHDSDGIDIYFLNEPDKPFYRNVKRASTVREIFETTRPRGSTPTGQRLNQILRPYLVKLAADLEGTKPLNIIVITDGEPSDDIESPIINAAKKLDRLDAPAWQIGIQFFQVGREPGARAHLEQLDDDLEELAGEEIRDIVDTVPWTGEEGTSLTADGILKVVLGAVNRRLDRKKTKIHQQRR